MTDHGRRELISSWLDGRLSAEESARLEQDLLHSRAARDEFRAWADLDSLLVQQAEAGQNNSGQNNSNNTTMHYSTSQTTTSLTVLTNLTLSPRSLYIFALLM